MCVPPKSKFYKILESKILLPDNVSWYSKLDEWKDNLTTKILKKHKLGEDKLDIIFKNINSALLIFDNSLSKDHNKETKYHTILIEALKHNDCDSFLHIWEEKSYFMYKNEDKDILYYMIKKYVKRLSELGLLLYYDNTYIYYALSSYKNTTNQPLAIKEHNNLSSITNNFEKYEIPDLNINYNIKIDDEIRNKNLKHSLKFIYITAESLYKQSFSIENFQPYIYYIPLRDLEIFITKKFPQELICKYIECDPKIELPFSEDLESETVNKAAMENYATHNSELNLNDLKQVMDFFIDYFPIVFKILGKIKKDKLNKSQDSEQQIKLQSAVKNKKNRQSYVNMINESITEEKKLSYQRNREIFCYYINNKQQKFLATIFKLQEPQISKIIKKINDLLVYYLLLFYEPNDIAKIRGYCLDLLKNKCCDYIDKQ
jgi:hypothetical protein